MILFSVRFSTTMVVTMFMMRRQSGDITWNQGIILHVNALLAQKIGLTGTPCVLQHALSYATGNHALL